MGLRQVVYYKVQYWVGQAVYATWGGLDVIKGAIKGLDRCCIGCNMGVSQVAYGNYILWHRV